MTFTFGDLLALASLTAAIILAAWRIAQNFRNHLDGRFAAAAEANLKAHDSLKDALNSVVQDVAFLRGRQEERDTHTAAGMVSRFSEGRSDRAN